MFRFSRSALIGVIAILGALVLTVGSTLTAATTLAASTALIMGGTGRPNPDDFPGYNTNVGSYYITPNTVCATELCTLQGVYTPESAWPVYGGPGALTWENSILQGVDLYDAAVQQQIAGLGADDHVVLFGYSQSGTIMAFEKIRLAGLSDTVKNQLQIVVIGDASRPNGGIDSRLYPVTLPIVDFPFGPPAPTDTGIQTTDIAFKWDIIADAPLYVTNPLAMLNALLGFEYVHGTYPNPTAASPNSTPGGYTQAEWQDMMDHPENYPDLITIEQTGDTRYLTVTPKVLPLVQPLHDLGLTPIADLIEPALRVIIEETGYDRTIPYGTPTGFRLIPIFNPITLAADLAVAIPQGVSKFISDISGGSPTPAAPTTTKPAAGNTIAAAAPKAAGSSTKSPAAPAKSGKAASTASHKSAATAGQSTQKAAAASGKGAGARSTGAPNRKKAAA